MRPYRYLEHTADLRLKIYGRTERQLLQNAVCALTDTLTSLREVKRRGVRLVRCRADQMEFLLVRLLQEVLFLFDSRHFLSRRLVIQRFDGKILQGRLEGERLKNHRMKTEIKAITYHGLKVEKRKGRWQAEVVVDV